MVKLNQSNVSQRVVSKSLMRLTATNSRKSIVVPVGTEAVISKVYNTQLFAVEGFKGVQTLVSWELK